MNTTEQKAFEWIKANYGLSNDQITFNEQTSPDFTTVIGNFEAKKLIKNKYINFTRKQLSEMKKSNTIFLVFSDEIEQPLVLSFNQITKKYKLLCNLLAGQIRIFANKKLMLEIKNLYPETAGMTYTGLVDWALRKLVEAKKVE